MNHLKMLGLLVVAAASLMAFASSASATPVLTSQAGTEFTGEIRATAEESMTTRESVFTETCTEAEIDAPITTNNEVEAAGSITTYSFGGCGGETITLATGSLKVNDAGEVFDAGTKVTTKKLGVSCIYGGGAGTKIGTLTGGTKRQSTSPRRCRSRKARAGFALRKVNGPASTR